MKPGLRWLAIALLVCSAAAAWPADSVDEQAERERIRAERAAVNQRFAERQRACAERFAVTACIDDARQEQREALNRLRRQESLLDAARRKQRAAERMQAIRERVSTEEARPTDAPRGEPRTPKLRIAAPREPRGPGAGAASAASAAASAPVAEAGASAVQPPTRPLVRRKTPTPGRHDDADARRAAFDARLKAAQAHREAVEKRNATRAASDKPAAAPLPPGPDASAP